MSDTQRDLFVLLCEAIKQEMVKGTITPELKNVLVQHRFSRKPLAQTLTKDDARENIDAFFIRLNDLSDTLQAEYSSFMSRSLSRVIRTEQEYDEIINILACGSLQFLPRHKPGLFRKKNRDLERVKDFYYSFPELIVVRALEVAGE